LVAARLLAHWRKTRTRSNPQREVFRSAVRLECSWVLNTGWLSHHLLELECDLIRAHLLVTDTLPPAPFIG
jgi:hypothetical protein